MNNILIRFYNQLVILLAILEICAKFAQDLHRRNFIESYIAQTSYEGTWIDILYIIMLKNIVIM